ncbi:hypothetical protein A1D31_38725 [Bradyrhizobium liaoningense]|nr:hypothetical protein A1D31_38725 [Bradyrhizobium liaoningense]
MGSHRSAQVVSVIDFWQLPTERSKKGDKLVSFFIAEVCAKVNLTRHANRLLKTQNLAEMGLRAGAMRLAQRR